MRLSCKVVGDRPWSTCHRRHLILYLRGLRRALRLLQPRHDRSQSEAFATNEFGFDLGYELSPKNIAQKLTLVLRRQQARYSYSTNCWSIR